MSGAVAGSAFSRGSPHAAGVACRLLEFARASRTLIVLLWVLALLPSLAWAQTFDFQAPANADDAGTRTVMRDLAERVLPVYQDADIERYLANLSLLQMVAGNYPAAGDTRDTLRERRRKLDAGRPVSRELLFDLYANARTAQAGEPGFAAAFAQAFREVMPKLGDLDAYHVTAWMHAPLADLREPLQRAFDRLRGKNRISLDEALELVHAYLSFDAQRSFGSLAATLAAEDDARRYIVEDNLPLRSAAGTRLYGRLVRPKTARAPTAALLEFRIDPQHDAARASAAHGYVGVVAYVRGVVPEASKAQRHHTASVLPFRYDGADARAVIGWIAKQAWSDGRVGMLGSGYSGFAAWAAARSRPPALKAIATAEPMAPGISFPTEGRVLRNSALRWALGHTTSGEAAVGDDARWIKLDLQWYRSGKPYWSLDRLITPRTAVFRTWLTHPSYDRYWQKMIPFRQQFARVDIPVLTIGGYYGDVGALYYFSEHQRYRPAADQTLVIGPYDDELRLERPAATLRGLTVDPVAQLDLRELQYQWFDQVLKGKPAPPLLKDRVNYQLMGTDQWRHTPSLAAMAGTRRRLYLQKGSAERLRLTSAAPADAGFVEQTVDFKDRSDLAPAATTAVFGNKLALRHALAFVSEPLSAPTELAGLVSGLLDFRVNKMDMDLNLTLYEQRVSGEYLRLSDPNEFRASYAADRVHRHLLRAGMRQQLKFSSERIVGCKLLAGSRLVVVLGVNKQPDRQINYGAGKNVSEESIADAGAPLKIRWYGASYVDLPMRP